MIKRINVNHHSIDLLRNIQYLTRRLDSVNGWKSKNQINRDDLSAKDHLPPNDGTQTGTTLK
jgi:hypothetical protein